MQAGRQGAYFRPRAACICRQKAAAGGLTLADVLLTWRPGRGRRLRAARPRGAACCCRRLGRPSRCSQRGAQRRLRGRCRGQGPLGRCAHAGARSAHSALCVLCAICALCARCVFCALCAGSVRSERAAPEAEEGRMRALPPVLGGGPPHSTRGLRACLMQRLGHDTAAGP